MKTLSRLFYLLPSEDRKFAFLLLAMILIMAFLEMVGVASIMPFISVLTNPEIIKTNFVLKKLFIISNEFGIKSNQQFTYFLGSFLLIALIISIVFKALTIYAQVRFAETCNYKISKRLIESYLHQPYSWFLDRHSADVSKNILSEVGVIVAKGLKPMINLATYTAITFSLILMLMVVNIKIALAIGLLFSVSYIIIYSLVKNLLTRVGKNRLKANKLRFTAVVEAFGAFKELKIGRLENIFIKKYADQAKVFSKLQAIGQIIGQMPRFIIEIITFSGVLILILHLVNKNDNFLDILPILTLYIFTGYRLLPALQNIYSNITQLRLVGPSLEAIYNDLTNIKVSSESISQGSIELKEKIVLNNISFIYPNSSRAALKKININIPIGKIIGIVGDTGSGKTTTIDIILGLLRPQTGTLEVDNQVINKENIRAWQQFIGYVPQNIYLSDDTIASNIAFGVDAKNIDIKLVERAGKIANIHDFVTKELELKYQTKVGERGVRLSGGQRQRIGIARALYHNPKVLVFDEATSALDNLTEKAVMNEILNLGRDLTIIIIAHRLSTVKNCDKIYLLENSSIIAEGTFEELIKNSDKFRANAI